MKAVINNEQIILLFFLCTYIKVKIFLLNYVKIQSKNSTLLWA